MSNKTDIAKYREIAEQSKKQLQELANTVEQANRKFTKDESLKYDELKRSHDEALETAETLDRIDTAKSLSANEAKEVKRSADTSSNLWWSNPQVNAKPTYRDYNNAVKGALLSVVRGNVPSSYERSAELCGMELGSNEFSIGELKRDQTVGDATEGGHLVPEHITNALHITLKNSAGPLAVCNIVNTPHGRQFPIPTINDTANESEASAELHGGTDMTGSTQIAVGEKLLNAYYETVLLENISWELLSDASYDVMGIFTNLAAQRIVRKINKQTTIADGSSKPKGFWHGVTAGATSESTTGFSPRDIRTLQTAVEPDYLVGSTLMMHPYWFGYIRNFREDDGNDVGQFLFGNGLHESFGYAIDGFRVVLNPHMPGSDADPGDTVMVLGNFNHFWVRMAGGLTVQVLHELYAKKRAKGILVAQGYDSEVIEASAFRGLKLAAGS